LSLWRIAFAVAAGFAIWSVLNGISRFVLALATNDNSYDYDPLSWTVGGRTLAFGGIVGGLVELGVLLAVAWWVRRRSRRN
jgi:hypothetical protein